MAELTLQPSIGGAKIQWPDEPLIKQNFSLPDTIIHYLSMNPSSPEGYFKLIQTCKFFFEKNAIFKTKFMENDYICINDELMKVNISTGATKIWLIGHLSIAEADSHLASLVCPKLYRPRITRLKLQDQNLTLDDFKLLAASAEYVNLSRSKISYSDGDDVELAEILENIPNVEEFIYRYSKEVTPVVDGSTGRKITLFKNLGRLHVFCLRGAPAIFNIEDLAEFLNAHKDTKIFLGFNNSISDGYKVQLDGLIDAVIEFGIGKRLFYYAGQDDDKYETLLGRYIY